jgi:A/G-specific adenine glycosylase
MTSGRGSPCAACDNGAMPSAVATRALAQRPAEVVPAPELAAFRSELLGWFRQSKRDLDWRRTRDPYRIWISEIMLQQTRVATVLPYYRRFLSKFSTIEALARAPLETVLRHWAGLGYYSRARNLHRAAKEIVARHNGEFPRRMEGALALPGIGHYTAAAVLSITYGSPYAVLDGNVARVLARLGAIRGDLRMPNRWRALGEAATALLTVHEAGDWNQAMMELGATVCAPRGPRCTICPVSRWCRAHAQGIALQLPARRRKRKLVSMVISAAVLLDPHGRTLVVKDKSEHSSLFSNLWRFPVVQSSKTEPEQLARLLHNSLGFAGRLEPLAKARHTVTFRRIVLAPFLARVDKLHAAAASFTGAIRTPRLDELGRMPISSATRKIAASALTALRR